MIITPLNPQALRLVCHVQRAAAIMARRHRRANLPWLIWDGLQLDTDRLGWRRESTETDDGWGRFGCRVVCCTDYTHMQNAHF